MTRRFGVLTAVMLMTATLSGCIYVGGGRGHYHRGEDDRYDDRYEGRHDRHRDRDYDRRR